MLTDFITHIIKIIYKINDKCYIIMFITKKKKCCSWLDKCTTIYIKKQMPRHAFIMYFLNCYTHHRVMGTATMEEENQPLDSPGPEYILIEILIFSIIR